MHNSESVISRSATMSALVGVFRSLHYHQDLSSASLLSQAIQKLPPNLKEAWFMYTVKKNWGRPTLLEFNDCLNDKAEAHERVKLCTETPKTEDSNPSANVSKTKTGTKIIASVSSSQTPSMGVKAQSSPSSCIACKRNTPCGGVRYSAKKCLPNGLNWLQATNFVFHAWMGNFRSVIARNHASA